ncbi:hypothetical protein [Dyella acidisoli]|uniref:Shikimate kinase n=1 Tax=Dyella acidisoli TaxID=1867834 RepID=A0ABQ5XVD3_9GAMM|nr:hypothetical protein [Dyella acidisoli]GLQ94365.1 hypothetical protein GCM10007901_33170 [Dyella acidisoli]
MTKQVLVVLDSPPKKHDIWAEDVFRQAQFVPVNNQAISDVMAEDEASRKALLEHSNHPVRNAEALAPYYRRALEKLYGDVPRLGLYGSAWLVYAPSIDACVIDWSEVERLAVEPDVPQADGEYFREQSRQFIHQRTQQYLKPERLHELDAATRSSDRAQSALDFLRGLGLA